MLPTTNICQPQVLFLLALTEPNDMKDLWGNPAAEGVFISENTLMGENHHRIASLTSGPLEKYITERVIAVC